MMTVADGKMWSLCVCGDLDNLLVALISEASLFLTRSIATHHVCSANSLLSFQNDYASTLFLQNKTVAELKAAIEQKSHVPVDEQSLYFQEKLLQDDCALNSIPGLCDGGMIYLSRRPISLVVISWLGKSPESVQIQLSHQIKV